MDYNRTSIRGIGSGFNQGETRWTTNLQFNPTPSSATDIDMADTSDVVKGLPIRYTTEDGGDSTYFYGLISSVTPDTSITIEGLSLSGETLTALWIGNPEMCEVFYLQAPGLYAVSTSTTILATFTKTIFPWLFGPASIVYFIAYVGTLGAGTAVVNVTIDGTNIDSDGVIPSIGGVASAAIVAPSVEFGDLLEVAVTTLDATSSDLTIAAVAVLE